MPSEFYNAIAYGFDQAKVQIGNTLAVAGTNYSVIASPVTSMQELREAGYTKMADARVEMLRTNFVSAFTSAANADRIPATLDGVTVTVMEVIDDAADSCVGFTVKLDR